MRDALVVAALIVAGIVLTRAKRVQAAPAPMNQLSVSGSADRVARDAYGALAADASRGMWVDGYFGRIWVPT